jgi:hypothetical protein
MRQFLKLAMIGAFAVIALSVAAAPAMAQLVLSAGPNQGISSTNNYGFTGAGSASNPTGIYWSGNPEVDQRHDQGSAPVAILFVFGPNGTISTYTDASAGTYDDVEDTQIGVLNLSGSTLNSIKLTATSGDPFGFDGDGISDTFTPGGFTAIGAGAPGNASDPSHYGGPMTYFSLIAGGTAIGATGSSSLTAFANFVGGLADGKSTYFSLEGDVADLANIGATTAPEPSSLLLLVSGLGLAGLQIRRRNRN